MKNMLFGNEMGGTVGAANNLNYDTTNNPAVTSSDNTAQKAMDAMGTGINEVKNTLSYKGTFAVVGYVETTKLYGNYYGFLVLPQFRNENITSVTFSKMADLSGISLEGTYNLTTSKNGVIGFYTTTTPSHNIIYATVTIE